ncbi:MAG: hypothetical protein IT376_07360 [Polyangiaceae bacterium]|nr:hypothetical protein [Polyangiaceae bacterium]
MARHAAVFLGLCAGIGCGGAPPAPRPAPVASVAPRPATSAQPAPAASSAAPPPPAPCLAGVVELPLPASEAPRLEILSPFADQLLPRAKAGAHAVRVRREPPGPVAVALDDHSPRRFPALDRVRLGELAPEGAPLADGAHTLVVAALDERGVAHRRTSAASRGPYAAVVFHVGARDRTAAPAPFVVLLSPRGTYNGERAADSMLVDALVLGAQGSPSLAVRITGPGVDARAPLSAHGLGVAYGLPSGDLEVEVAAAPPGAGERAPAAARRTVTVNLDAPVPPPQPIEGCRRPRLEAPP